MAEQTATRATNDAALAQFNQLTEDYVATRTAWDNRPDEMPRTDRRTLRDRLDELETAHIGAQGRLEKLAKSFSDAQRAAYARILRRSIQDVRRV